MDPETLKYYSDFADKYYDECIVRNIVQTADNRRVAWSCTDLLCKKNPGGQLVPIPALPAGFAFNPLTVRFHSYLRQDTNNPLRDCLLKKAMLEARADDLITILQDLGSFANAVGVLTAYQAACANPANAAIVADIPLYDNRSLCTLVCLVMRIALTPTRAVDPETVQTVQTWGYRCGFNVPCLNIGDTYAHADTVLQLLFSASNAAERACVKQVFCKIQQL